MHNKERGAFRTGSLVLLASFCLSSCLPQEDMVETHSAFTPSVAITTTTIPATPTIFSVSELAPYYGKPQPAQIIIDGKAFNSGIGVRTWVTEAHADGTMVTIHASAEGIITGTETIPMGLNPSFILKLPIPIDPAELSYILYTVSEQELASQDPAHGAFAWNLDYKTQSYVQLTDLPLLHEQQLTWSLEPGLYVLEVYAGWEGNLLHEELHANFGFLFEAK